MRWTSWRSEESARWTAISAMPLFSQPTGSNHSSESAPNNSAGFILGSIELVIVVAVERLINAPNVERLSASNRGAQLRRSKRAVRLALDTGQHLVDFAAMASRQKVQKASDFPPFHKHLDGHSSRRYAQIDSSEG